MVVNEVYMSKQCNSCVHMQCCRYSNMEEVLSRATETFNIPETKSYDNINISITCKFYYDSKPFGGDVFQ